MSNTTILVPRQVRHHGATGKTLLPTLAVGTLTTNGQIVAVRKKKKYPRRYLVARQGSMEEWMRRDQFTVMAS